MFEGRVMMWRVSAGFAVTVSSLAMGFASGAARADEGFLCGPDKIVYVAPGQLEIKKRSDPCIAAYFGLTAEAVVTPQKTLPAPPAAKPAPAAGKAGAHATVDASVPAPERAPALNLKTLTQVDKPVRDVAVIERQAALRPAVAVSVPEADYRNIRVINAAAPERQWFHHDK